MGFKLFDEIGNEEIVVAATEEVAPTLTVEEVISADMAEEEVQEVATEIASYARAIEDGATVAERLEAQIATESALLTNPEAIAASTVVLAHESMKVTAAILGAEVQAMDISTEAIEKSPATALEVSIEEKESFLKKVAAKIKAIIAKMMVSIKKLGAKILISVSNLEKKAKALSAKVEKDYKSTKLTDGEKQKLAKLNGTVLAAGIKYDELAKAMNVATSANETFVRMLDIVITKASKLKLTSDGDISMGDAEAFTNETVVKFGKMAEDGIKALGGVSAKLSAEINKDPKKFGIAPLEAKDGTEVVYNAIRYDGGGIKVAAVRFPNAMPKAETYGELLKKAMELTEIKYLPGSVKIEDVVKTISDDRLSKAEVVTTLKDLEKAGASMKNYSKAVFKGLDNSNKLIKIYADLDLGKATSSFGKIGSWLTTANTAVTTDAILGVYKNVSNTIAAMNIMAGGKEESSKKEEKKEEEK